MVTWAQVQEVWEDLQDLMVEIAADLEIEERAHWIEQESITLQKLQEAGIEFIEFSPDVAERYLALTDAANWESVKKLVPDLYPKYREMLTK